MIVLAIETATQTGSVALLVDDALYEESLSEDQTRSGEILFAAERCFQAAGLAPTQCDAIAVGRGPGSFTGLRVGMGVAQGIAYGIDRPVIPVSSLRALAQACPGGPVLVLLDARMQEVYWGCFAPDTEGWMQPIGAERVSAPEAVVLAAETPQPWSVAGNGWARYGDRFSTLLNSISDKSCDAVQPRAREIARLGAYSLSQGIAVSPLTAYPEYLRNEVVKKRGSGPANTER
ncbi:MAG: tRNA (adenosine(37)-N6)-threonylcarbamoyltransferase complex dimerization subunit type 1 TsaB [Gammaproteobacteria bacterium]|nr:tRNA (adenosine(37)-N6)-threonylcarbamoyltransferase complex dimerization subunit type 1 TsaB [Gammaproteobacteria bacterium]